MNLSPKDEALALELAEALDDVKSLMTFQRMVSRYSETFLREVLNTVVKTPKERIKNSRGAYFTFLVNQRAHSQKHYDRD